MNEQENDVVFCICFDQILHDFKNSKSSFYFLSKFLYKQFRSFMRNFLSKFSRNFRFISSIRHLIEIEISSRFYNNAIMQKLEKTMKIHNQFEHVFVRTFRNFLIFISFRNYKKIDQSNDQNYIQCENVEFEKFSTVYDDLNRIRKISMQKRKNVMKIFIQIRFVLILTFQFFSSTKNFFQISKQIHNFHRKQICKTRKSTKNIHTKQS